MEHHQRSGTGNTRILETMTRYFRVPASFEHFVYLSQVQQALAIQTGVQHWRRLRPLCMGTLYWQLNDLWPVCSWASLEYSGKWKLLHYAARRFYAPTLVAGFVENEAAEVWAVHDGPGAVRGTLEAQVLDFSGRVIWSRTLAVTLGDGSSRRLLRKSLASLTPDPTRAFLHLTLKTGDAVQDQTVFLTTPKACEIQNPRIRCKIRRVGHTVEAELACDRPAFFVSLDIPGVPGRFDDNLITLLPGVKRTLVFKAKGALPAKAPVLIQDLFATVGI
jgi:beta-mannosidase